jgi:assimilatory nitrate reductase catalytic subunit
MLHAMIWDDRIDRGFVAAHTNGFDALKALVRDTPPREAARICGVPVEAILQAADWFAASPATLSLWCQGLNQSSSGTAKNTALINLHLATGQIGRPGAGPLSLTGQPNAMGGREVGGLANLLSAHRDLANPRTAPRSRACGASTRCPSAGQGRGPAVRGGGARRDQGAVDRVHEPGPVDARPGAGPRGARALRAGRAAGAFAHTATARYADVLLPASTWAEKDGTVTNSERRISRVRAAIAPPGDARDDWRIVADFARRLQARLKPELHDLFPYESSEAVWNEHRESTRGRDLDITGLSYALLESAGPQQWPAPAAETDAAEAADGADVWRTTAARTAAGSGPRSTPVGFERLDPDASQSAIARPNPSRSAGPNRMHRDRPTPTSGRAGSGRARPRPPLHRRPLRDARRPSSLHRGRASRAGRADRSAPPVSR